MLFGIEWDTSSHWAFAVSIFPILMKGLVVTLQATAVGFFIAIVLGLVLAGLKAARLKIISWPARFISEFIRDTPLLVQLFFLYYVLPEYGIVLPAFMTGALALGLQYSAYISEVYRAGIESIPATQWLSARAIGLSEYQIYRFVVLPQAVRRILPAATGQFANLVKDSSLLFVISVPEFTMQAREVNANTYATFEAYLPLVFGYLLLTLPISLWSRRMEQRFRYEH